MKHTIQFGVKVQPDGSVQVRIECTCGQVFAEERVKTVAVYNYTSADIMDRLWREAQAPSTAHTSDMERGLMLYQGLKVK